MVMSTSAFLGTMGSQLNCAAHQGVAVFVVDARLTRGFTGSDLNPLLRSCHSLRVCDQIGLRSFVGCTSSSRHLALPLNCFTLEISQSQKVQCFLFIFRCLPRDAPMDCLNRWFTSSSSSVKGKSQGILGGTNMQGFLSLECY